MSVRADRDCESVTLTKRQWKKALRLLGKKGQGYWRVVGKGVNGNKVTSQARRLMVE